MEPNERKQSRMMVPFLLVVIAGLVAVNFYQNRVIRDQSAQIRWLLHQGVVFGSKPAAAPAPQGGTAHAEAKPSGQPQSR